MLFLSKFFGAVKGLAVRVLGDPRCIAAFLVWLCLPLAAEVRYHVLQKGETLYSLARTYDVPYQAFMKVNSISDPSKLKVGQKLLIPRVHAVTKGETLFGIARIYGIPVSALYEANNLGASSLLRPGELLVIPGGSSAASSGGDPKPVATKPKAPVSKPVTPSVPASPEARGPLPPTSPKTLALRVDPKLSWPCSGPASYLDGKLFGLIFRPKAGDSARAVASGKVISAGPYRGYGQVALVQYRTGLVYVYGGNEMLSVREGDLVRPGQELGRVGIDAKEGKAIAYFFVFKNGTAMDPAKAPRD